GPRHQRRRHLPASRRGLRLPRRRGQPPGVPRPLHPRLAGHPRGHLRPGRRRALRRPPAPQPVPPRGLQRGGVRAAAADRARRAGGQVQPDPGAHADRAGARGRGRDPGHRELRDPAQVPDGPALRRARLLQAQLAQGAAAPARDPRGGPRTGHARHDRGRPAQARDGLPFPTAGCVLEEV
ncbi:MAG: hypothetical protein AVDCRST_MAG13-65, partial [uncultured Solirubrobacteraceae bacterium]